MFFNQLLSYSSYMHLLTLGMIALLQDSRHSAVGAGVSPVPKFSFAILYNRARHASTC